MLSLLSAKINTIGPSIYLGKKVMMGGKKDRAMATLPSLLHGHKERYASEKMGFHCDHEPTSACAHFKVGARFLRLVCPESVSPDLLVLLFVMAIFEGRGEGVGGHFSWPHFFFPYC